MDQTTPLSYATYDVFTDTPFGGNPLAVVWGAEELSDAKLQIIAREFNYSETVFILTPSDPTHASKLRIFTPTQELPFAGHPTIGAIIALSDTGHGPDLSLELGVGPLAAQVQDGVASIHATQALKRLDQPDAKLIAGVLTLDETDLASEPVMASMGVPFTFTQLHSREALRKIAINDGAMKEGNARYPSGLDFAQLAYWVEGEFDGETRIHMRMFAPLDGIPEDPATGSAAAALSRLLFEASGQTQNLRIIQGEDMGRLSKIHVTADADGVRLSGQAVKVMEGKIIA